MFWFGCDFVSQGLVCYRIDSLGNALRDGGYLTGEIQWIDLTSDAIRRYFSVV